jgi:hypothetical protein
MAIGKTHSAGSLALLAWMEHTKTSQASLAADLGVSDGAVNHWIRCRQFPSLRRALALEKHTEGAVPVMSWGEATATPVGPAQRGPRPQDRGRYRHGAGQGREALARVVKDPRELALVVLLQAVGTPHVVR